MGYKKFSMNKLKPYATFLARRFRMKTGKQLLDYVKEHHIPLNRFNSELDFFPFLREHIKNEVQIEKLQGIIDEQAKQLKLVTNQAKQLKLVTNQAKQLKLVTKQAKQLKLKLVTNQVKQLKLVTKQAKQLELVTKKEAVLEKEIQKKKAISAMHQIISTQKRHVTKRTKQIETFANAKNDEVFTVAFTLWTNVGKVPEAKRDLIRDSAGDYYARRYNVRYINVTNPDIRKFATRLTPAYTDGVQNKGRTYDYQKEPWQKLIDILCTDSDFENIWNSTPSNYINCIVINNATMADKPGKKYDPYLAMFKNSDTEGGMYHKYINYSKNKKASTFNELFVVPHIDYVAKNYHANSCFITALVDTYHDSFAKCSKYYKFKATYEEFCELLDIDLKKDNIGLSIKKSLVFFEKFKLGLCVLGIYGVIKVYQPAKPNKNISPSTMYIVVHNGHVYQINEDLKSIQQKLSHWKSDEIIAKEINNINLGLKKDYILRNTDECTYNVQYIDDLNDILEDVKNCNDDDNQIRRYVYSNNLKDLLMPMVHETPSYSPDVRWSKGKIISLRFKIGSIIGIITNSTENGSDKDVTLPEHIYQKYHEANDSFYKQLFTFDNMSFYNPTQMEIDNIYQIRPCTGYFDEKNIDSDLRYNGLDCRKAYTSDFLDMEHFPVYNYFDVDQEYTKQPIDDYTMYKVHCSDKNQFTALLFPKTVTKVSGWKLNKIKDQGIKFKILSFNRPSKLNWSNSKRLIDKLWETDISDDSKLDSQCKKDIFNINSGLLEKKHNSKTFSKAFKSYDEAFYYQTLIGGKILIIDDYIADDSNDDLDVESSDDDLNAEEDEAYNNGVEAIPDANDGPIVMNKTKAKTEKDIAYDPNEYRPSKLANDYKEAFGSEMKKVYLLVKNLECDLTSGFVPIKEMIYDIRSVKNYFTCVKMMKNGITPIGVQTDSILFEKKHTEKVKKLFDLTDKIGCFKIEYDKLAKGSVIKRQKVVTPELPRIAPSIHKLKNERDLSEMNTLMKQGIWAIVGLLPGVGKTYAASHFDCKKKLFVSPYNKLCQYLREDGHDAITTNMLLGLGFNNETNFKIIPYDVSEYDCIVFDEVLINPPRVLMKIQMFMEKHSEKKFLCTGDCKQNTPIEIDEYNNITDKEKYLMHCFNMIFPNQILLQECKRLSNPEDQKKMAQLRDDIFDQSKDVMTTLKKYGFKIINKMSEVKTKNNICYFNFRCDQVNGYVHNNLVDHPKKSVKLNGNDYWKGLDLVCKKHYKSGNDRLFVNYRYDIKSINSHNVTVNEPVENIDLTFPISFLANKDSKARHFRLNYANTSHSVQGMTIKDEYTIFDANTPRMNRNCLWTCLTRTDNFNKITIFEHSDKELESLSKSMIKQYLDKKVENYQTQDKKANRSFKKKDYVTADWIVETCLKQKRECKKCKCAFEFSSVKDGHVDCNLTVDRVDCSIGHIKSNCRLLCHACNVGLSNKGSLKKIANYPDNM
jgi:hypothetical protein